MSNLNTELERELLTLGMYLQKIADTKNITIRKLAADTSLSINSVRAVYNGKARNVNTYDTVARYLGSSFSMSVLGAFASTTPACSAQS